MKAGSEQGARAGALIAVGASTGGPQAIETILRQVDPSMLPILVTQHMPENFTRAFAKRLDDLLPLEVKEAAHGDFLVRGRVLIAPGGKHMRLRRIALDLVVELNDGALVNRHKPSVDVLFHSVVEAAPQAAMGILLTGMGGDGARGLLEMRQSGYATIAQDEASSVVWGMPREAVKLGAVDEKGILPLDRMASAMKSFAAQHR